MIANYAVTFHIKTTDFANIENGAIAEMGNHAELIRARGYYYRLYTQQFRKEREAQVLRLPTNGA